MNILVTGHNGFIGSRIVKRYKELGYTVWVSDKDLFDVYYDEDLEMYTSMGKGIDVINHHAAQTDVRKSGEDPTWDAQLNIMGTLKVLEIAKNHNVKKLIYASSGGACYGNPESLWEIRKSEKDQTKPISHYGLSKLVGEKYIELSDIPYTILRYSNVWSEDCSKGIYAVLRDNPEPIIFGDGTSTRDYVHVDDVVESNVLALDGGLGEIINIGSGKEVSINQLVEKFGSTPIYDKRIKNEVNRIFLDVSKAKSILGWSAKKYIMQ